MATTQSTLVWAETVRAVSVEMRMATALLNRDGFDPRATKLLAGAFFELANMVATDAPVSELSRASRSVETTLPLLKIRGDLATRLNDMTSHLKWIGSLRLDSALARGFREMAIELERNLDRRASGPSPVRRYAAVELVDRSLPKEVRSRLAMSRMINNLEAGLQTPRPDLVSLGKIHSALVVQEFESPMRIELTTALGEALEYFKSHSTSDHAQLLRSEVLGAINAFRTEQGLQSPSFDGDTLG